MISDREEKSNYFLEVASKRSNGKTTLERAIKLGDSERNKNRRELKNVKYGAQLATLFNFSAILVVLH